MPMALMNDPSPVKTPTALLVPSSPILPHAFLPAGKYYIRLDNDEPCCLRLREPSKTPSAVEQLAMFGKMVQK